MSWMIPLIGSMVNQASWPRTSTLFQPSFSIYVFSLKMDHQSSPGIWVVKINSHRWNHTTHPPSPRPPSSSIGRCSIFKSSLNDRASPHAAARKTSSWPPEKHPSIPRSGKPFVFPGGWTKKTESPSVFNEYIVGAIGNYIKTFIFKGSNPYSRA